MELRFYHSLYNKGDRFFPARYMSSPGRVPISDLKESMKYVRNRAPLLVIILIALIFPLIADSSDIAIQVLLLMGASAAWNIFSGYTGYISLGQATYYGLGAYTLTLASQDWHMQGGYGLFLLLPLAGLVAGVFSLPLGWIALHTRRYTFMVITIAIFFIFQLMG
jgi:branched-chain amino acid transport system permease protein